MLIKTTLFLLPLLFSLGCSVYKSQGRKSFETDTPARLPIALIFYCRDSTLANAPAKTASWEELKAIPSLVVKEAFYQKTVVLLASSPQPDLTCISESLDLADYSQYRELFASQLNTWP